MDKLRSVLLYDGLNNKEDYDSVVWDLRNQNRKAIALYSLLVSLTGAAAFACSFSIASFVSGRYTYLFTCIGALLLAGAMLHFGKKSLVANAVLTYVFSLIVLGFAILTGTINNPDEPAVAFCVVIAILPFLTYDAVLRSLIFRIIAIIVFITMVFQFKNPFFVWTDVVDVLCYSIIGAVIGIANQQIKAKSYFLSRNMDREIKVKTAQIEGITVETIKAMSDTLDAKDEYTRGHSNRVSEYAALIAEKMELPKEVVSEIKYAATLHDIGKIGVPDSVLNKPGRLTDEEYEIIKKHCTIGADILGNINMIAYTADIARHHHERYDGKGYPEGLKGEELSIGARIVAVADAFDAMNSRRVYRKPLDREIIIGEIEKNKGVQFDPQVAEVFLELLRSGAIDEVAVG